MPDYIDSDEVKAAISLTGETFADDDIELACTSASKAIDGYARHEGIATDGFGQTAGVRLFTANRYDVCLSVSDLVAVTSLTVDTDDDGDYDETWVEGTDFVLDPANAEIDGVPYSQVTLVYRHRSYFPGGQRAVRIDGNWGWPSVPSPVKQSAKILAVRLVTRSRQAPLGIVAVGSEAVAAARLGRIDPDVAFLLGTLPTKQGSSGSLQLG
jgi:hypothetical protein